MRFHCKICDITFKKFVLFEGHFDFNEKCREKHSSFVQCYICSKDCTSTAALKYHLQQHTKKRAKKSSPRIKERKPKITPTPVIPKITLKKQWNFKIVPNKTEEVDVKNDDPKSPQLECKNCGEKFGSLFHLMQHSTIHGKKESASSAQAVELGIEKLESIVTDAPSETSESTAAQSRNQCPVCKIILRNGGMRLVHHMQQHTNGKFYCKICKIKFTKTSLTWHTKLFHGFQGRLKCKTCGALFTTRRNLATHEEDIHERGNVQCKVCKIRFTPHTLRLHQVQKLCGRKAVPVTNQTQKHIGDIAIKRNRCTLCKAIVKSRCAEHIQNHKTGAHKCEVCDIRFTLKSLIWHRNRFHPEASTTSNSKACCTICKAVIKEGQLAKHMENHKTGKFECNIGNIRFSDVSFELHQKRHHPQSGLSSNCCTICKAQVKTRDAAAHMQHHKTGKFKCKVCNIRFSYLSLIWHQKRHHPEDVTILSSTSKTVHCTICKVAVKRSFLAVHMQNHKTGKFKCEECNIRFTLLALKWHQKRFHPGAVTTSLTNRQTRCTICKAMVRAQSHVVHMQNHKTGKFKCEECDIRFSFRSFLYHQKRHHPETDISSLTRKCQICEAIVSSSSSMSKHLEIHEIGEAECEICNIRFTSKGLSGHRRKFHPEHQQLLFVQRPCAICRIKCYSKAALDKHADMHENGPFQCETHQIKFTLEAFRAHNNRYHATPAQKLNRKLTEKQRKMRSRLQKIAASQRFQCKYCKLRFCDAKRLAFHVNVHTDGDVECRICKIPFTKSSLAFHEKRFHPGAVRKERVLKAIHRHISDELQKLNELEPKDIPIILEDQYRQLSAKNDSKYQCIICKLQCGTGTRLDKHLTLHIEGEYKCEICSIWFSKQSLDFHQKRDHPEFYEERISNGIRLMKEHCENEFSVKTKKYQKRCDICSSTVHGCMDVHKQTHITGEAECKICNIRFTTIALRYHQKRYHPEMYQEPQIIECLVCKLTFMDQNSMENHMTVHTEADTQCDICNIPFTVPSLRYHMKRFHSHVSMSEIIAKALERNMVETSTSTHQQSNGSERQCQICGLKYSARKDLLTHMKVHAYGNLKCPVCNIWFTQHSLDYHCKRSHPDFNIDKENKTETQHPCTVCSYVATDKTRLREHTKVHRGDRKCRICNIRFTKASLVSHYKRFHPNLTQKEQILKSIENCAARKNLHNCPKCGKSFTRICYLKLHIKYHRNAVEPVEIPFVFSAPADQNSGPAETNQSAVIVKTRNYECYVCNQPFKIACQLQDHLLRHLVYEQWEDPLNVYLSNWDPEESREIISLQPVVLVENLNIRDINLKSLANFGRPIENLNQINETGLKYVPTVESDVVAPDTTQNNCEDIVEILSDSDDDYETIQNQLNNNAKLHVQPKFPETENPTNELVYISSDDEEDITDSFHCFYCNNRFRTLAQFGEHERICQMKGEPDF